MKKQKKKTQKNAKKKSPRKKRITPKKAGDFLKGLSGTEELFHILKTRNKKEIELILEHYKKNRHTMESEKLLKRILSSSKDYDSLNKIIKKTIVSDLKKDYKSVKKLIKKTNRKGKDTYIEELKLEQIPPKIRMFETTFEKKDFYRIKKIMSETKSALNGLPNRSIS